MPSNTNPFRNSDPGGARTHDLLIKSQLLCQLSYRVADILTRCGAAIYGCRESIGRGARIG